jgi:hypothetical protein
MTNNTSPEYRQDAGGSVVAKIDSNGFLRIDGVAAKAGVLTYLKPDGSIVRELVTAGTLFHADALATLQGAPVTVGHPVVGLLNAENARSYSKGAVGAIKQDGTHLAVSMTVTDSDAISAVNRGSRQLSPGYTAVMDYTPGEFEGQHYDAIQVSRTYNHLAIVDSARGGPECKINLDGFSCAVEVNQPPEEKPMPTVKLPNGATVEVADASTASTIQSELNSLQSRADAADEMVDKAKFDELQGKYDSMVEEMAKLKEVKEEKADADQIGAYISVIESARKLKADVEVKADGKYLDPAAIMAAALGIDAAGRSIEYIQGRFDSALELQGAESIAKQRETKTDSAPALSVVELHRQQFLRGKA